jgi:hypothetical protein
MPEISLVVCPHCDAIVEILELNCKIFRHGIYKNNNQQINPHASKEECDSLVVNDLIYGCGKPFRVENNVAIVCEYI